jgi:hypothetical protein
MGNMSMLVAAIIVIVILIVIFLICREIVLWYFRINRIIEGQTETNVLLERILKQLGGTLETESKSNVKVEDTNTYDYVDDKGNIRNVTHKTANNAGWTLLKK